MREFEKWWEKNSEGFKQYPHSIATACFKKHKKNGWKAALECVLSEGGCSPACGYKEFIEKELNN